jgi:catechol 2,3-dioxygenase-like lactoylglutathione lyase family enzyme
MNKTGTYVHHTGITVSDLNRSIPFYRDVLGFAIEEPFGASG